MQSRGLALPQVPTFGNDVPPFDADAHCKMRSIRGGGQLNYPPNVLSRFGVGSVVVHFGLDSGGAVTSRTIAAAVPTGTLAAAVETAATEWKIERDPSSPRGCRIPSSAYVNVRFVLG
jgi:TonB family protein